MLMSLTLHGYYRTSLCQVVHTTRQNASAKGDRSPKFVSIARVFMVPVAHVRADMYTEVFILDSLFCSA